MIKTRIDSFSFSHGESLKVFTRTQLLLVLYLDIETEMDLKEIN